MRPGVILDCGSGLVKAGFGGEDAPRSVFPTVVGHTKLSPTLVGLEPLQERYVGYAAQRRRGILSLTNPILDGRVTNWEDMEAVWDFTFREELHVAVEEHPVLLTEPPLSPTADREHTAQVMFEGFSVPALYTGNQAVLALYSTGRTAGVVVDSGEGVSYITPIYQGCALSHAARRCEVAGKQLTAYLAHLLNQGARCYGNQGCAFSSPAEREIVRDIKEKLCYTGFNYNKDSKSVVEKGYELPDGQHISVGVERVKCSEALFKPSLLGRQGNGLHAACWDAVSSCAIDLRRELCANIVLAGGTTKLPGLDIRLGQDLKTLAPPGCRVKVSSATPDRLYSVWVGGSILASLVTYGNKLWVTKQEYEERGAGVLNDLSFFG